MNQPLSNYNNILKSLKEKIKQARLQASLSVNAYLIAIYWEIGNTIHEQESAEGWGSKIIATLSKDLKEAFPDMKGFSERNLRYMRDFALAYPEYTILQSSVAKLQEPENLHDAIWQPMVAKLPWTHHTRF